MPLSVSQGPGAWVKHFVHSDNSRFKGKSVKQLQKMGLAAYYSAKRAGKESMDDDDILQTSLGEHIMEPTQKIIENKVHNSIFEITEGGEMVYHVKVQYNVPESDAARTTSIDVRALSPEEAKTKALALAREMDFTNVSVLGVDVVADMVTKFPIPVEKPLNPDPRALTGMVAPSAVSPTLSNAGRVVAK